MTPAPHPASALERGPLQRPGGVRALIPQAVRERLYGWHPGRERRWRQCPGLERVRPHGRLAITFDDGPDRDATPAVLAALDEARSRATFFLVGEQVERDPALASEIHHRGHELALHCQTHRRLDRLPASEVREDMLRGFAAVYEATGVSCRRYRPPFGRMSTSALEACRELGMSLVYWSAWGLDWEDLPAARIAQVAQAQLSDGAILLLHDSARYARRPSARATAEAVPLIAAEAAARGLTLASLEQADGWHASLEQAAGGGLGSLGQGADGRSRAPQQSPHAGATGG